MSSGPYLGLPSGPEPASYEPIPGPGFTAPYPAPTFAAPALSDHDLRQLPPPTVPAPGAAGARTAAPQRPGTIAVGATLAVTASLLWVCVLGLAWVTATVGADELGQQGEEGPIFHILNRFAYRMVDGLAWPLFGFPLLSLVTGLAILSGRSWTRVAHTAVGALALVWSAWWLRDDLAWWVSPAAYVAVACLVLWTPGANRWFSARARSAPVSPAG